MAGQAQWPGTEVAQPTQGPAAPPIRLVVPPQAPQPGGQTADQAALVAEQLRAARLANDTNEGVSIPGDSSQTGEAYLRTLPQADQEQVRALSEGRIPWPAGRAATSAHWQQIIAATGHYDPTFDAANYTSRTAARRDFVAGQTHRNLVALNTALHHVDTLRQAGEALHNSNYPLYNRLSNWLQGHLGYSGPNNFDTDAGAVADEVERVLTGGGTLAGRNDWRERLSSSASPEQMQGAFRQIAQLLAGRVDEVSSGYQQSMGTSADPISFLSPRGREILSRLGGAPPDNSGAPPVIRPGSAGGGQGGAGPTLAPGRSGTEGASSDAAPAMAVTERGQRLAAQATALLRSGASIEQMNAWADQHGVPHFGPDLERVIQSGDYRRATVAPPMEMTAAGQRAADEESVNGPAGLSDLLANGASFGLHDEASGMAGAISNIIESPFTGNFDPVGAYQTERDADTIQLQGARDRYGWGGTAADVLGSFGGANPAAAVEAIAPGLMQRVGAGARMGGEIGTVSGFGHGRGPGGSTVGAVEGGAEGAGVGALIPLGGSAARSGGRVARGAYRTVMGENPDLAQRVIAQAIEADGNTAASAGAQMSEAHANGVPAMLADTGDNARGLLAASARAPGPTRTLARDALDNRQAGLAERVTNVIQRDLGPVANPHQVADDLMTQARTTAAPLYDAAYTRPGADAFSNGVRSLLSRPSMQRALQRASRIAEEEGRNPRELGFVHDADGNVALHGAPVRQAEAVDTARARLNAAQIAVRQARQTSGRTGDLALAQQKVVEARDLLRRAEAGLDAAPVAGSAQRAMAPSWQTMDYVKRGMDDVIERYRDPTSGRLNLDTEGRAINNTQRTFLRAFDAANPDYAAARAAYGGPVRGIDAMNEGRRALSMTADDLEARIRDMSPFERQMFATGARRAMAELVASKGDTANVVTALVGTGKKRAMLSRLFGDRSQFNRFVQSLHAEQEAYRTYSTARLGSPTAPNLQDDAALREAGNAVGETILTGTPPFQSVMRFLTKLGTRRVDSHTQQQIASLLSETDPARLNELAAELRKEQTRQAVVARRRHRAARALGVVGGEGGGSRQGN